MANNPTIRKFVETDPKDFADALEGLALVKAVTFASATLTLGTVPANSVIGPVYVARTTRWDAITDFLIGKSGDTDWLVTTVQANVDGPIDSGEDGNIEIISVHKIITSATDILLTLNQGAAAAGAGFVLVPYRELSR